MPTFALHVDSCKKLFEHLKLKKSTLNFSLVAIGSIITDLEEFGIIQGVHGKAEEFFNYLLKNDPKYAPLGLGMILHEELDHGIDTHFVNPNIKKAQEILTAYDFTPSKVDLAAHYLIDHSVNCLVLHENPRLIKVIESAKKRLKTRHVHKIAYHLSTFFSSDEQRILKTLHMFKDFDIKQYLTPHQAADLYGKFLFLQQELKEKEHVGIVAKIKLGLKYGNFMMHNRRHVVEEMGEKAKTAFAEYKHAYKFACTSMIKRFKKISLTHAFGLEKAKQKAL